MIPLLNSEGQLPVGVHLATWSEVRRRFGSSNPVRRKLMRGLERLLALARRAGARGLYLDGSFTTAKPEPGDWDAVLVLRTGTNGAAKEVGEMADRRRVKREWGGDLFLVMEDDAEILAYYVGQVFVRDREGRPKGILKLPVEDVDGPDQG